MTDNTKPIYEAKHRQIRASVFQNYSKDGKPFFNTQLVRRYKNSSGDWVSSSYLTGEEDLIMARSLIDKVIGFIRQEESKEGAA